MIHTSRLLRLITDTLCLAWGMPWIRRFPLVWFPLCDLPIAFHRSQWGSALPLGVTSWSVQPWSYRWWEAITASGPFGHCHLTGAQWSLVEVVGICTKESTMKNYLQCLCHLVQQFWEVTCGPQFPSWLVPDCCSDRSREGRWLWPVLKWHWCFPGQAECVF